MARQGKKRVPARVRVLGVQIRKTRWPWVTKTEHHAALKKRGSNLRNYLAKITRASRKGK